MSAAPKLLVPEKPRLILPRKAVIVPAKRFVPDVLVRADDGGWIWRRYSHETPGAFTDWRIPDEASMSAVQQILLAGGFAPVTHTYNSGSATNELCPIGASNCQITLWSAGGGGAYSTACAIPGAGGTGGYTNFSLATPSADWNTNWLTYTIGTGGIGKTSTSGNGTAGGLSSLGNGTLTLPHAVSITGGGGGTTVPTGGTGGVPTNLNTGATNTTGFTGGTGTTTGLGAPNGGGNVTNAIGSVPGGAGSAGAMANSGKNGAVGEVIFAYT